jgi:hypothetical protein
MKRMTPLDRVLLLATGGLAAYQVAAGVKSSSQLALVANTVGFGVLLVAGLLLIIFGFEILDSSPVVVVSALIPLSLSVSLVAQYSNELSSYYLAFAVIGLLVILVTRYRAPGRVATVVLACVHGIAGIIITFLPFVLSLRGISAPGFAFVGVGGTLIGVGGLLLALLRGGRPLLPADTLFALLPALLLGMTTAFVAGFALGP